MCEVGVIWLAKDLLHLTENYKSAPGTALNLRSKFVISQEVLRDIFYSVSMAYSQLAHVLMNIKGSTQCKKNTLIKTKFGFLSTLCHTVSLARWIHISKYLFYNLLKVWVKVVVMFGKDHVQIVFLLEYYIFSIGILAIFDLFWQLCSYLESLTYMRDILSVPF